MGVFKRRKKSNKDTQEVQMNNLLSFLGVDTNLDKGNLSEVTYFSCLKVLSEAIGKMPLKLLRRKPKNGVSEAHDKALYDVIRSRPNPYMTATTFWSTMENNRNHYGNAYALISGAGSKTTLWILPSDQVTIVYDDALKLKDVADLYYVYSGGGKQLVFGSEEIIHLKSSNTFDGVKGISVADQLKLTINGAKKGQQVLNKLYDNGFTGKMAMQYTGSLNDDLVTKLAKGIEQYAKGGLKDKGVENIIPIPVGTTLTPLNVKLADSQFIEIRQYTALQIASAFGIKPYQIGDYNKSSYASAEAQQLSFLVDTLLFIIKQYEEELSYKLLSQEERNNGLFFKFNVATILRADLKTQIDTLSAGVANFIYTPNEARALLDMEAKDGGDKLLGNGASIPVELTGSQYTQNNGKEEQNAKD